MAKFLPSELISEIRNKAGASVFSRNRGGAVVRAYNGSPANPNTVYQQAQRAAVKALMSRCVTVLTESQRQAWQSVGVDTFRVDVLAQRYNLTGNNHFMAVNLTLFQLGFPPVDDVPVTVYATDPGPLALVADSILQKLVVTATRGLGVNEVPFIRVTGPYSPGVNYLSQYLRVLPFPGSVLGQSVFDFSSAWLTRFGPLPQDRRVGVQLQYVNSVTGSLSSVQTVKVLSSPEEVDSMLQRTINLTAAQVRNLSGSPQIIVPSPGSGYALVPLCLYIQLKGVAVPFLTGSSIGIFIGPPGDAWSPILVSQGNFTQGPLFDMVQYPVASLNIGDVPGNLEAQPLYISVSGADYTAGDGTVNFTCFYVVVPTP